MTPPPAETPLGDTPYGVPVRFVTEILGVLLIGRLVTVDIP